MTSTFGSPRRCTRSMRSADMSVVSCVHDSGPFGLRCLLRRGDAVASHRQSMRNRGMQERQQNFVMTNQLDAVRRGPVENINPAAILALLVQIDGDHAVQVVAEI